MGELKTYIDNTRLPEKERAVRLHDNIVLHANMAAGHLVEFYKDLKQMKDTKLYEQLGYNTFEEYTEGALGIKQRQAYSYISAIEKLGEDFVTNNAQLGVSKLALLASASVSEREELSENIDVENVSYRQLEDALEEIRKQKEQLSFLAAENEELKGKVAAAPVGEPAGVQEGIIEELKAQHQAELDAAVEAARSEARLAMAEAAKKEARAAVEVQISATQKEKAQAEKEAEKAKKEAEKAKKDAEKAKAEAEKIKKDLEAEKNNVKVDPKVAAELEERNRQVEELKHKLDVASNDAVKAFAIQLRYFQDDYKKLVDSIKKATPEEAEKFKAAVAKLAESIIADMKGAKNDKK